MKRKQDIEQKLTKLVTNGYDRAINDIDLFILELVRKHEETGFDEKEAKAKILSKYQNQMLDDDSVIIESIRRYRSAYISFSSENEEVDFGKKYNKNCILSIVHNLLKKLNGKLPNNEEALINNIEEKVRCCEIVYRLSSEKQYENAIDSLTNKEHVETKTQILAERLQKYNFFNLTKTSVLSKTAQKELLSILSPNKTPYVMAMLDYLGFVQFMYKEHCKNYEELHKYLSDLLGATSRVIKGNRLVLNEKSNEDREKYTAHLHKKEVEKEYNRLKEIKD